MWDVFRQHCINNSYICAYLQVLDVFECVLVCGGSNETPFVVL